MPKRYSKKRVEGDYFYLSNKGYNGKSLFRSENDRKRFLTKLRDLTGESQNVRVVAFYLAHDSCHLVLQEIKPTSISKFMHKLTVSYAMYYNARYDGQGKLFVGPYKEVKLDTQDKLIQKICDLHKKSVDLGIEPEVYKWSSFRKYVSGVSSWIHKAPVLAYFKEEDPISALRIYTKLFSNGS